MSKKTPVQIMESLVCNLPNKDIEYANKFIQKRDFESLREIVNSDITKLERKCNPSSLDEGNLQLEEKLNNLCKLRSEIDAYLLLLGYSQEEISGNYDDADIENDSYYSEDY